MNQLANRLAHELRKAADNRLAIPSLRDRIDASDIETAYNIQKINAEKAVADGRRLVGRKIGLVSPEVQKQLGIHQPDFGTLFADMEMCAGLPIQMNRLIQPKIEIEIAFMLGRDLTNKRPTVTDVLHATDYLAPAFDIVDSRIQDWDIQLVDTIADNASAGLYVLGAPGRPLPECVSRTTRTIVRRGDEFVFDIIGSAYLDSLNAMTWLATEMLHRDSPLRAGDLVLSGALGPMVSVEAGNKFTGEIEGLGQVSACFT